MRRRLERLSQADSPIHRLNARIKILSTLLFMATVLAAPRHEPLRTGVYLAWPLGLALSARLPLAFLGRRILEVSPFVFFLVVFNPFFEAGEVVFHPFNVEITREGLLTSAGILVKFVVTLGALLVLLGTTPFSKLVAGFRGLGLPEFIALQIAFIYRYLALLVDQASRMRRAREVRLAGKGRFPLLLRSTGGIIGSLFLRTLDRGERIHLAMRLRGFDGTWRSLEENGPGRGDVLFIVLSLIAIFSGWLIVRGGVTWMT